MSGEAGLPHAALQKAPSPAASGGALRLAGRPLTWLLSGLVWGYRLFVSPLIPPSCRYAPTCSAYALEALQAHGPVKGAWLAARRIARCHPWGGSGYDPVPGTDPAFEAGLRTTGLHDHDCDHDTGRGSAPAATAAHRSR